MESVTSTTTASAGRDSPGPPAGPAGSIDRNRPAGRDDVLAAARRAQAAARVLAQLPAGVKNGALAAMAAALRKQLDSILQANADDVAAGREAGVGATLLDRLALTPARIEAMAAGLETLIALPDPVGEVLRGSVLANGLRLQQVRVPLGVVAVIYEARPNVTVDAAGIALKAGNAVLLRGSASAWASNRRLVDILAAAGETAGLPSDAVAMVPGSDRGSITHLMTARGLIDVIIPRGGAALIKAVVDGSTVPVIETGVGNCHVYVDAVADIGMALDIVINSKTRRPAVCNAAETLLVHRDIAARFLPPALSALGRHGVTVHGDPAVLQIARDDGLLYAREMPPIVAATATDFDTEYLSKDIAVAVVDDIDAAIAHIQAHGTGHTEAVVTSSLDAAALFTGRVDAAVVMVNASTAFTDGGEFGFGAEIGISTQKLHARGPMGLTELTSTKYIVTGAGQVRGAS